MRFIIKLNSLIYILRHAIFMHFFFFFSMAILIIFYGVTAQNIPLSKLAMGVILVCLGWRRISSDFAWVMPYWPESIWYYQYSAMFVYKEMFPEFYNLFSNREVSSLKIVFFILFSFFFFKTRYHIEYNEIITPKFYSYQ